MKLRRMTLGPYAVEVSYIRSGPSARKWAIDVFRDADGADCVVQGKAVESTYDTDKARILALMGLYLDAAMMAMNEEAQRIMDDAKVLDKQGEHAL